MDIEVHFSGDENVPQMGFITYLQVSQGFPGGSGNSLPAMQETQVQSLSQEDPLEKGMAIRSSIVA